MRRRVPGRAALSLIAVVLAAVPLQAAARAAATPGWLGFGGGPARLSQAAEAVSPAAVGRRFIVPLSGRVTAQVLYADGVFVAASTAGDVVGFDRNGLPLWRAYVGQLAHACPQLDGYGVVGTGVIDAGTRTVYVLDAFGWLHALALATGVERRGWPVRVFTDSGRELGWGALALASGSVYAPTAAYCETPGTPGGVFRVDLASRSVARWLAVPLDHGGGGGPWGWGGVAVDAASGDLFVGTSGAFSAGSNIGTSFTETAGSGDRLVELSRDLKVVTSSHPAGLPDRMDLDFVGSPLLVSASGCGAMVVGASKNDTVYGWRRASLASGWAWKIALEPYSASNPFVSQLAWSAATSSVYAVTGTQLVRIKIAAGCKATVAWRKPLGTHTENGSPTIAGGVVWFANNGTQALVGYDASTGARVFSAPLGGTTLQAPTIVAGRLVVGTFSGLVEGFETTADPLPAGAPRASATSWADARNGWQSRANGVYATGDGGKVWHRIYPQPALAVLRLSASTGVISTGYAPGRCMCSTRQLWTDDNGKSWHGTATLSGSFAAGGGRVYFWQKGTLRLLQPLANATGGRLSATTVASVRDGTIVAAAPIAGGVVALVSNRVAGQGWDSSPRVIVAHGGSARVLTLPRQPGEPLVVAIGPGGKKLTVTARDFDRQPARTLAWTSTDSGASWAAHG
jgi:hypothetical protein